MTSFTRNNNSIIEIADTNLNTTTNKASLRKSCVIEDDTPKNEIIDKNLSKIWTREKTR